ncbi:MAG TPA: cyclic nucleotide-gated ion channel [Rhizomicrobium sp.]|jgi:voltage-gated potassium channel|nr:cyclic nucleotide-gated ion channel [Rhizomicrobium sp.]
MSVDAQVLPPETIRRRLYVALEGGPAAGTTGLVIEGVLIVLIVANVVGYILQSVPWIDERYWPQLIALEIISVAIFTIEYIARLWVAPEDMTLDGLGGTKARLRTIAKPMMLIDFLAIAPSYVMVFIPFFDLRFLRLIRLLRLLKIARYSPALSTLVHVLVEERRALYGTLLLMLCAVVFAAAAMHAAEGGVQPEAYGSIPEAMWWAITTLTTVGYGDVVPITAAGKAIAGLTMIVGLGLFALPVGIIATGFVNSIHRRDFVVTFGMLARVPLFRGFDVHILSEMMHLLRSEVVNEGGMISARGEVATAMYFIVSGEVEAQLSDENLRFGPGDFFGELALLHETMRSANIVARTQCRLLVLSTDEFAGLMHKHPALEKHMEREARRHIEKFGYASEFTKTETTEARTARDDAREV